MTAIDVKHQTRESRRLGGLDGLRGFFMIVFMGYHFGLSQLDGAWIAISMFFVLSAYLIGSLLMREYERAGSISFLGFYQRRVRRLLPALFTVLLFVGVYALATYSPIMRKQAGGDILASLGFFLNWRLIGRADDYFAEFGSVPLLRHLWTLSVEEQFYILVPAIVLLLIATRRRSRAVVICLVLVAVSLWMTQRIGISTVGAQSRVYYGTDTRMHAFAIGLMLAVVAPIGKPLPAWSRTRVAVGAAWISFVGLMAGVFLIPSMSNWVYAQGGVVLIAIALGVMVLGAANNASGAFGRAMSVGPLAWAGVRSYGLYLWHWPVIVVLKEQAPQLGFWAMFGLAFILTFILASFSYRFLEKPVIDGGFGALLPSPVVSRTLFLALFSCVLVASAALVRTDTSRAAGTYDNVGFLDDDDANSQPLAEPIRVGITGDSVAHGLAQNFPSARFKDIELVNLSVEGCDFSLWTPMVMNAGPIDPDPKCVALLDQFEERVRDAKVDVVLMVGLNWGPVPHWDNNGLVVETHDRRYLERLEDALEGLLADSLNGGAESFVVTNIPCRQDLSTAQVGWPENIVEFARAYPERSLAFTSPTAFNKWLGSWANGSQVPMLDLYSAFRCDLGFRPTVNRVSVWEDFLHYTPEGSALVWSWVIPRIREQHQEGQRS